MHMLAADEVEAIVIVIDAIVDANAIHLDVTAERDTHGMIRARDEVHVAHRDVLALIQQEVMRTLVARDSGGRHRAASRRSKLSALPIDGSLPFDRDILRVSRED